MIHLSVCHALELQRFDTIFTHLVVKLSVLYNVTSELTVITVWSQSQAGIHYIIFQLFVLGL